MATNKVVYNGKTLIDLSSDTVTASTLVEGTTAHNKAGNVVTGTVVDSGSGDYIWKKYYGKVWNITTTDLGKTEPSDCIGFSYNKGYAICDDGYFIITKSDFFGLDGYSYIIGKEEGTKPTSIYYKEWIPVLNGNPYNKYYLITVGNTYSEGKGGFIGYVTSDTSSTYPDDGLKNGYYYVKVNTSSSSTGTNTSDATATAANILSGKTAYISSGKTTGTMKNNGAVTGTISTKAGTYTIPSGYHSGSGKVSISSTEQNKIIASNIKSGVSILGVTGTYTGNQSGSTSSNNNCEAYLVDVTDPAVSFKTASGAIKAYGYAYATTKSQWGGLTTTTMYAFNGTNYYKSVTYGTPSATSITLGVSNGKLTGLPDLASGTLLVTRGI